MADYPDPRRLFGQLPPLAAHIARHLKTKRWGQQEWSAHQRHNYDSDCAICLGDINRIATEAAEAAESWERPRDADHIDREPRSGT